MINMDEVTAIKTIKESTHRTASFLCGKVMKEYPMLNPKEVYKAIYSKLIDETIKEHVEKYIKEMRE